MENVYEVVHVSPSQLKSHSLRSHYKTTHVERLEKSISEFGIRDPLKVQRGSDIVFAGNTRLEVANNLGLQTVPVIYYNGSDEEIVDWMVLDNAEATKEEQDLIKKARTFERMRDIYASKGGRPKKPADASEGFKTVEEVARIFGVRRSVFTQTIRLLNLIPELQSLTSQGKIGLVAGDTLASLSPNEQKAFYESIKEDAKSASFTVTGDMAKDYRETFRPKATASKETVQETSNLHELGEVSLDFTEAPHADTTTTSTVVVQAQPSDQTSVLDIFGDETTELMQRVNNEFEYKEGVQGVEVDKRKKAEVEKVSNAFADKKDKVVYKRNVAKRGIVDAKNTITKIESQLPAVFSTDLFEDEESTDLPVELESLEKVLMRLAAKVEALKKQFA